MALPGSRDVRAEGFVILALLCSLTGRPALSQEPPPPTEDERTHIAGLQQVLGWNDVKVAVANMLLEVKAGRMTPEVFYQRLSRMDTGKQPRFFLIELKSEVLTHRGEEGARYLFGEQYGGGGSYVEHKILSWRRDFVYSLIREVIGEFKGRTTVDGVDYKVFYSEIGSWPTEKWDQMKLAGDIDFSFICGNRELALQMKQAFERLVIDRVGMTPEAFDAVCTAHGMASPEVYIAEHGAIAAERMMLENQDPAKSTLKEIDFDKGTFGRGVAGRAVLETIALQARLAVTDVDVRHAKHPTEPGISMEMIRHFMHDIVHNPVFTDLESFMKAAKYMERSDGALAKAFNLEPSNPRLAEFAAKLTAAKGKGTAAQIDLIRDFFGGRLPGEVKLGPTQGGKTRITVEANQKLIEGFWEECRRAMWDNARRGFETQIETLRRRIRATDPGDLNALRETGDLLFKVREMMEVEFRILEHPKLGTAIPPETVRLMGEFRGLYSGFMSEHGPKIRDISGQDMKHLRFLEEQLRANADFNLKLALATTLNYANRGLEATNQFLDYCDNTLMGDLRGERGSWQDFLNETHQTYWAEKVNSFVGTPVLEGSRAAWVNRLQQRARALEEEINPLILNNFPIKLVRQVNQAFSQSVQASPGGQLTMKSLMAFNLYQEIPAYVEAFEKEGWRAVATEFFVRRVPGGAVVQDIYMGEYCRALWDGVVLFVPPAALFQAAFGLGQTVGGWSWSWYWSAELDYFLDALYEGAQFSPAGVQRVGQAATISTWKLERLSYRGIEVEVPQMIESEKRQIEEMRQACRLPLSSRVFPMEYVFDGISRWTDADSAMRENLVDRDTFLALVDTMKKNPHVGPKLMDHYRDLWYTRFEQVKLDFVLDLKRRFEERKAAATAEAAGEIPQLDAELQRVARDLRILPEIEASLEARLGGGFVQFLGWIRDTLKNIKREALEQPPVEDVLQKGQRELVRYLKVYSQILAARQQAEKQFALDQPEDHGLRLLTTPFQLTGDPDKDEQGHLSWAQLPAEVHRTAGEELGSIKQRLAGDSTLNTEFDRRIEGEVAFHEVWKRLWRHVQTATHPLQGSAGVLDFETWWELWKGQVAGTHAPVHAALDSARAALTGGGGSGPGAGELPLARFRDHDAQRDRLVAEFTRHYLLEGSELGQGVEQAERLSREMEALCAEARTAADEALKGGEAQSARAADIQSTLAQLTPEIARLAEWAERVDDGHRSAETETVRLGELAAQAERSSLALCEKLKAARAAAGEEEKARLVEEMRTLAFQLGEGLAAAEEGLSQVKERAGDARAAASALESTLQRLDTVVTAGKDAGRGPEPEKALATAMEKVEQARMRWAELSALSRKADEMLERARAVIAAEDSAAGLTGLLNEIQGLHGRIRFAAEQVRRCPDEAVGLIETAGQRTRSAAEELKAARAALAAQEERARPGRESLSGAQKKAGAAEYLVQHAEGYLDRLRRAAEAGALCFSLARDLLAPAGRVALPDLSGLEAAAAKERLEKLGLTAAFRAGDPAPQENRKFTVQEQFPAAGQSVPRGSAVTVRLFGDLARVLVPDLTGFTAEGARAALEAGGLRAVLAGGQGAPKPGQAFTVAGQNPSGGQELPPGGEVTLHIYGAFDPASILGQVDCSPWPGTRPVWVEGEQRPACACPDPGQVWSPDFGACVSRELADCPGLDGQFRAAMQAGDLNTARQILEASRACPWFAAAADFFNQQVQQSQQAFDQCAELESRFWQLINNRQVEAAAQLLEQAAACPFAARGWEIIRGEAELACQALEIDILRACRAGDLNAARNLLAQAQQRGCRVSPETYHAVQSAVNFAQRQAQDQRNQQMLQAWSQFMNTMNQFWQNPPARQPQPTRQAPPTFQYPGRSAPSSTPVPSPAPSSGGGGRNAQDCERQFCPMCRNDIDLLGASVDPQCNDCRRLNADKIAACARGDSAGQGLATTKVYRVICFETWNPQTNRFECLGRHLLNPDQPLPPKAQVFFQSTSWDECKRVAEER